jgi:hypothetical protein
VSMESDFRAILIGDVTLVGFVATRVYPSTYAQGAISPAIRYTKVVGSTGLNMSGADGLSESTMQVDVRVADSGHAARDAQTIRDRVVELLHGYRGTEGETEFQLIAINSDRGIAFDDAGATKYYSASLDFDVWHRAAT